MRTLTLSLLMVVLASIVALGWALDHLYGYYTQNNATSDLANIQLLTTPLAQTINSIQNPLIFVAQWPAENAIPLELQAKANFPLPVAMQKDFDQGIPLLLESDNGVSLNYYLQAHQMVLTINLPDFQESEITPLKRLLTAFFYAGVLTLLLLWLYPLLTRLQLLRSTATTFGAGDLKARIDTRGLSYIREIEHEFNRMAQRIQTLIEDNKLLSSAVSHDLRTPLARLRFGIDTLADSTDITTFKKYYCRLDADLIEMEKLVGSLLSFARLDHSLTSTGKQPVDLTELLEQCIAQYYDEPVQLSIKVSKPVSPVNGSAEYLGLLVNNLVQNAVQHASEQVQIALTMHGDKLRLSVCDDGPGIPPAQRSSVMKPFNRGLPVKSNMDGTTPGYGLGLAIVGRISQWHDAIVSINDCPILGGAEILIVFDL